MTMPFEPNISRSRDAEMVAAAKPFFLWTSFHGDRKPSFAITPTSPCRRHSGQTQISLAMPGHELKEGRSREHPRSNPRLESPAMPAPVFLHQLWALVADGDPSATP